MRHRHLIPTIAAAVLLLASCTTPEPGPTQTERTAAVRQTWDVTRSTALDAVTRIEQIVIPAHPELTFTAYEHNDINGAWRACDDEAYDNTWDGPDQSYWLYGVAYDVEPREPTVDMVEPLVQSYLAEGWTLWRDYRGEDEDTSPWVDLRKDGYTVQIVFSTQHWVDTSEDRSPILDVTVMSPCVPSPDNLTEWDREHPDDYSFVTEAPPEPTW